MFVRYVERLRVWLFAGLWNRPTRIVIVSFAGAALSGALLLMLPISTNPGHDLSFLDALFTAVSAVCVTGLIVVDTPVVFTGFGLAVILTLIQIGGLGIMVFSVATIFIVRKRFSVSEAELLSYMLNERNRTELGSRLLGVLRMTVVLELAGATILALVFMTRYGYPIGRAGWFGLFHAISAFCNAGFALFSDSLEQFATDGIVTGVVMGLIVLGGLGFATNARLGELVRSFVGVPRRRRVRLTGVASGLRSSPLTVDARIAVLGALTLTAIGWVLVYFFETGGAFAGRSIGGKYLLSLFQSVTLRTAGFNTVPFADLHRGLILAMVPIMLIGGASGGTAGGVKTGTVAVLIADVRRFMTGGNEAMVGGRRLPGRVVTQASTLITSALLAVTGAVIVLSVTESAPVEDLLFEAASALGTVGLSTGITGSLTPTGRIVIIVLMFAGRLGPLTLLGALRPARTRSPVEYSTIEITVG